MDIILLLRKDMIVHSIKFSFCALMGSKLTVCFSPKCWA